jgi:hypothetical protein
LTIEKAMSTLAVADARNALVGVSSAASVWLAPPPKNWAAKTLPPAGPLVWILMPPAAPLALKLKKPDQVSLAPIEMESPLMGAGVVLLFKLCVETIRLLASFAQLGMSPATSARKVGTAAAPEEGPA